MNEDHIQKIFNYNKLLSGLNHDRKKKYQNYRRMIKTNNSKNNLLQNEKKLIQEKNKIINILLQDLYKKQNNKKIYSNLSSIPDINKLREYLK